MRTAPLQTRTRSQSVHDPRCLRLRLLVPTTHRLAQQTTVAFRALPDERWVQGRGDTGGVLDAFAAAGGFPPPPRIACRSSDYRFMSALVSAGVGIALVPRLALPTRSDLRDLALRQSPTRYVGAYQAGRRRAPSLRPADLRPARPGRHPRRRLTSLIEMRKRVVGCPRRR